MKDLYQLSQTYLERCDRPYIRNFLKAKPFENQMTALLGQRGIGKTTVLIQYLRQFAYNYEKSEKILYLPVDHFRIKKRTLYDIAVEFLSYGGHCICFDEIHKYPNWSQELKSIYDSFPYLKVIASGSSALEIFRDSHDLSRRVIKRMLPGFSLREYIEISQVIDLEWYSLETILERHIEIAEKIINILKAKELEILPLFKQYLNEGYYPMIVEMDSNEIFFLILERIIHTSIETDIISTNPKLNGESIIKIKQLFSYLSQQAPLKVDIAKIKNALSITDYRTIKLYLQLLENVGCIKILYPQDKNIMNPGKAEKIYLQNTNKIYALAGNYEDLNNIRETFFVNMLSQKHEIFCSKDGNFIINEKLFEVGGKDKEFKKNKDIKPSYLALDEIELGINQKIPLWLFGFLY